MAERIGELQSKRDLYSKHFLNSDGSITAEISGVPVHYRDGEQFKDCELNLIEERNWEFEYAVKKNNFRAYFNDTTDLENYTLASFEVLNSQGVSRWINYKLFGATPTEDIVRDNTIKYKNCFQNVDLKYYVDTCRLKEDIIINAPVSNFEYEFSLKLDGVRLEQQQDGNILFVDIDTEEVLWRIEKPYAKDADDKLTYGVQYTLGKVVYNGAEYDSIRVQINDMEFLQSAVYPIIIDPTTDITGIEGYGSYIYISGSYTYPPTGTPTVINASGIQSLTAQKILESSKYSITTTFMKFNTASLPDNVIITSATLKLYVIDNLDTDKRNFNCEYYPYTNLTTSDYAENVGTNAFSVAKSSFLIKNSWETFILDNPTNINKVGYTGFRFGISGAAPTGNNWVKVYNGAPNNPVLSVIYNTPPTTPEIKSPNGGETYNASATITWLASIDPDGDTLTYEIDYSTNNGSTWTNITTSATGTSYNWNCSAVIASSTCLVRIRAKDSGGLYSAYDQSNVVFTIRHNFGKKIIGVQAPSKIMGSTAMKVMGVS